MLSCLEPWVLQIYFLRIHFLTPHTCVSDHLIIRTLNLVFTFARGIHCHSAFCPEAYIADPAHHIAQALPDDISHCRMALFFESAKSVFFISWIPFISRITCLSSLNRNMHWNVVGPSSQHVKDTCCRYHVEVISRQWAWLASAFVPDSIPSGSSVEGIMRERKRVQIVRFQMRWPNCGRLTRAYRRLGISKKPVLDI